MYSCPVCGATFETYKGMRTHMWQKHPFEYRETRLREIVKEWGVPDEIYDKIDFHAYTDPSISLEENIEDLIRAYPILRRYRREITLEDIELAEKKARQARVEQAKEYIEEVIEDVLKQLPDGEKEEVRKHLLEIAGVEEEGEYPAFDKGRKQEELEKRIEELEKRLDELLRMKREMEEKEKEREEVTIEWRQEPEGEEEIVEFVERELASAHPDFRFDVKVKGRKLTITGTPKPQYKDVFKKFTAKVSGDIDNYKYLIREITDMINKARGGAFLPYHLIGGLKIWFKCNDMNKVLQTFKDVSGIMLSEYGVFKTKSDMCYIPFDLRRIGLKNQFRPTNQKLAKHLGNVIDELRARGIKIFVDTETGYDPDTKMVYPIDYEDILFITEEEEEAPEEKATLEEYAVERLADYLSKKYEWE